MIHSHQKSKTKNLSQKTMDLYFQRVGKKCHHGILSPVKMPFKKENMKERCFHGKRLILEVLKKRLLVEGMTPLLEVQQYRNER